MEPNIIDYYNETPHGVNVIDKLNEEYDELQKKYDELKKKINKFKLPFIIVNSIEEYKRYDDIISNQFGHKIRDFLHDEETGLLAVINEDDDQGIRCCTGPWSIHEIFENSWWKHFRRYDRETCKEKIINELNNITNNKNKEWCELRIDIAFETSLKNYLEHSNEKMDDEIIEDLIHHIFNDENNDYLPRFYIELCDTLSKIKFSGGGLYDLLCFRCEKCGNIDNYMEGENKMICSDCLYPG